MLQPSAVHKVFNGAAAITACKRSASNLGVELCELRLAALQPLSAVCEAGQHRVQRRLQGRGLPGA